MRSRPVVPLLALVLLAGCSGEVAATAVPSVRSLDPDAPPGPLSEEEQADLDDLADWREWDPCGFLPSSAAAPGSAVDTSSADDPSSCTARTTDEEGAVTQLVLVTVGTSHGDGAGDGETTDTVDGTPVYRSSDGPTACTADVRLSATRVLSLTVNQLDEDLGGTACAVLDPLVRPVVAALGSPPRWSADASPVVSADPCAAVRESGGDVPRGLGVSVHRCSVLADGATSSVRLLVGAADERADATVGGFDAVVDEISDGGGCRVLVLGRTPVDPLTTPEPDQPFVGLVEASTTDDFRPDTPTPTCEDAQALAEAAVEAAGLE